MRIQSRADGGRTHVYFINQRLRIMNALDVFADHDSPSAEFLSERHRYGVLQLCASHFNNIRKFHGLCFERQA